MREREPFEAISSTVSLGLLAEDMVLVLSRVIRSNPLEPRDRRVLEDARDLFASVASASVVPVAAPPERFLFDDTLQDTLRAVRVRVPKEGTQQAAQGLAALIAAILAGKVAADVRMDLETLRSIFIDIGKAMLLRANDLSRSSQEPSSWQLIPAPSPSF